MKKISKLLASAFSLENDKASNEDIRDTILAGANIKGTNMFILMMAIFIACIGLNMNSTAVIIGAMLISPLMGGIMAIGYGMATNDIRLVRKAFVGLCLQVVICIATSALYFTLTPISIARSEILARTTPTIWDVMIAIVGGMAGIVGVTRKEKSNVIPGVAIATALMPPLCTVGYGLAMGESKYFFGAAYLFFINSFFICVSTFIIVSLMKIPKKSFMDEEKERKVKRYIWLIGIITIIPSIFLGYQIVAESVRDSNIERYVQTELVFDNTQIVSKYLDKKENILKISLLGKRISQDTIDLLENKLQQYNLKEMTLQVTQTESVESLKAEDIQGLIEKELQENKQQVALGDRDGEIERLNAELIKYKTQVMEYQLADFDIEALTKEIKALYPQIDVFSVGKHKRFNEYTGEIVYKIIVKVDVNGILSENDKKRIENWVKARTNSKEVELVVNEKIVAPPTSMPETIVPPIENH